jgi:type IV fimbrial biogenesis protein FimT
MRPAHRLTSKPGNFCRGFTLMELILTVALLAILAQLSLPAMDFNQRNEADRVFMQLSALLTSARAHSIATHSVTVICPSVSGSDCDSNWSVGAIAFTDSDNNRQRSFDEALIELIDWTAGGHRQSSPLRGTLHWRAFGNRQSIRIDELGQLSDQNGNFTWCTAEQSGHRAHQMVINSAGRIRLATDSNKDGHREDSQGRPLTC